jgi:hypothetical protein
MASGSGDDSADDLKLCSDYYDVVQLAKQLECDFPRGGEFTQLLILAFLMKQTCLLQEIADNTAP